MSFWLTFGLPVRYQSSLLLLEIHKYVPGFLFTSAVAAFIWKCT